MSIELLYTSAERGLRQGSRGFCTVLSTSGTPLNLAARLEALSGYRHQYPIESPHYNANPIALSHVRMTVAGRPLSVVSRIAAYDADYSGRTNKLAHHIVVEPYEASPAGAAWLLMQPGVMRERWDGNCAALPTGPTLPMDDQPGGRCQHWEAATGDAGWGGVVADAWRKSVGKPTWLIYPATQHAQLLDLINESIALLPAAERWQATFSTYALAIPPDVQCQIRCVPDDSKEARFAAARGQVIRLQPTAFDRPTTPLVAAARGEAVTNPSPIATRFPSQTPDPAFANDRRRRRAGTAAGPPLVHSGNAPPPPMQPASSSSAAPPPIMRNKQSGSKRVVVILGLVAGLVLMLAFAGIVVKRSHWATNPTDAKLLSMGTDLPSQTPHAPPPIVDDLPPTVDVPQPRDVTEPVPSPPIDPEPKKETEPDPPPAVDAMQPSAAEAEVPAAGQSQEVQARGKVLETVQADANRSNTPIQETAEDEKAAFNSTDRNAEDVDDGAKEINVPISCEKAASNPIVTTSDAYLVGKATNLSLQWSSSREKSKTTSVSTTESFGEVTAERKGNSIQFTIKFSNKSEIATTVDAIRTGIQELKERTLTLEKNSIRVYVDGTELKAFNKQKSDDLLEDWLVNGQFEKNILAVAERMSDAASEQKKSLVQDSRKQNGDSPQNLAPLDDIMSGYKNIETTLAQLTALRMQVSKSLTCTTTSLIQLYSEEKTSLGFRKKRIEEFKIRFNIRLEDYSQ